MDNSRQIVASIRHRTQSTRKDYQSPNLCSIRCMDFQFLILLAELFNFWIRWRTFQFPIRCHSSIRCTTSISLQGWTLISTGRYADFFPKNFQIFENGRYADPWRISYRKRPKHPYFRLRRPEITCFYISLCVRMFLSSSTRIFCVRMFKKNSELTSTA